MYVSVFGPSYFALGLLFFLCVSRLNVYAVLLSGWSSNSKYALLGAIRAVAQTISYEVRMSLVLMVVVVVGLSFDFFEIGLGQKLMPFVLLIFPIFCM